MGERQGRRRAETDVAAEAAALAKEVPGRAVQLLWTREEDMQHGWYRPAVVARLHAGLDAQRRMVAWQARVASSPVIGPFLKRAMGIPMGTFPDRGEVGDAVTPRYRVPNLTITWLPVTTPVPTGTWRSVSNSYGAFLTECFIDEVAREAGADPYLFRRGLLEEHPRHRAALDLAADKSGWSRPLAPGRGHGIAIHECFGSIVAEVVEVHTLASGAIRVDRVVAAVDCGLAVNPAGIEQQIESGVVYGLSAALYGAITVSGGGGRADQLPRLRRAAHACHAAHRDLYCPARRAARRHRRGRHAAGRARRGQCDLFRHRQTGADVALAPCRICLGYA